MSIDTAGYFAAVYKIMQAEKVRVLYALYSLLIKWIPTIIFH